MCQCVTEGDNNASGKPEGENTMFAVYATCSRRYITCICLYFLLPFVLIWSLSRREAGGMDESEVTDERTCGDDEGSKAA